MKLLPSHQSAIPVMNADAIANVAALEQRILALPQVEIRTHHVLHAGMYARTIVIPGGVVLTGALIKVATMLVISGDVLVSRGEDDGVRIIGNAVIPASAGRKQAFIAYKDTSITMLFPTQAKTIEETEAEFTDDTDRLMSRQDPDLNIVVITGEH